VFRTGSLYLSLYFKTNRPRYYDLLQRVWTEGAWEEWLVFFLEGTETMARAAADAPKQILTLFAKDRDRIRCLGRAASSALRVHEFMQRKPLVAIGALAEALKLSIHTVTIALDHLVRLGITREVTGRRPDLRILALPQGPERRNRFYSRVVDVFARNRPGRAASRSTS